MAVASSSLADAGAASAGAAASSSSSLARVGAASPVGAAESVAAPVRAQRGRRTQIALVGLGLAAAAGAVIAMTATRGAEVARDADRASPVAVRAGSPRSASGAGSAAAPPSIAQSPPVVTPPSPHAAAPGRPSSSGGGTIGDLATSPKPAPASGKRPGDATAAKKGSGRAKSSSDLFGDSWGGAVPVESKRPAERAATRLEPPPASKLPGKTAVPRREPPPAKAADPTENQGAARPSSDGPGAGGSGGTPRDGKASDGASTATGAFQTGSGSGSASEPSLDELLGERSTAAPEPKAPRLERTSLSADDFKRGMAAVDARARACFAGTQGLASLRLTVAPSGRVASATVSGMFAGSPVGACVERAVRAAKFPPWDGRPQRFSYSYLLSD
jgi:hypothetical protein